MMLHLVTAVGEAQLMQLYLSVGAEIMSHATPVHRDEIKEPRCKARVTKTKEVAASDIRFDIPLAEACYDDRHKYCDGVAPGSARVIRCLQDRSAPWSFNIGPICPPPPPSPATNAGLLDQPCRSYR